MFSPADIHAAHILIVDDLDVNVCLLQQILHEAGYVHVSFTRNPREVGVLHSQHHYDLILLDIQMPGMDGFEVMADLKRLDASDFVPILAITAYPKHKLKALACGAQDFIAKPFDVAEVTARIHNLIEARLRYKCLVQSNLALASLALHDALTGLPNRRLLMDRLHQTMLGSARSAEHGALMFLDLDHFKHLNDSLGHEVGDILLQQVAARMQACVREGDSVARLGGDEFVVLLDSLGVNALQAAHQTALIAAKILEAFTPPFQLGTHRHACTASLGMVLFQGETVSQEELLHKADTAMYQAKTDGRNRAHFFDPDLQAAMDQRPSTSQP